MSPPAARKSDRDAVVGPHGWPYHSFCIAAFPSLALYSANLRSTPTRDFILPLLVSILAATLLVFFFRVLVGSKRRASILTSGCLALVFAFGPLDGARVRYVAAFCGAIFVMGFVLFLRSQTRRSTFPYLLMLASIAFMAGKLTLRIEIGYGVGALTVVIAFFDARFESISVTRFLNGLSIALLVSCAVVAIPAMPTFARRPSSRNHGESRIELTVPETKRDIYFLVFDRYAGNETLRLHYGFDNGQFLQLLRQRGFTVLENSYCNYPLTPVSMSATLNLEYHDMELKDKSYYERQLRNHQVGQLLTGVGYRYWHIGNWYTPLRHNKMADVNFRVSWIPSEFASVLYEMTVFARMFPATERGNQSVIRRQFAMLSQSAEHVGPKFVYAHFLLPHPPFIFDRDGSELTSAVTETRSKKENYLNQLLFANDRIVSTVDHILSHSEYAPIIVIQSDEGPYLDKAGDGDDDLTRTERIRKRLNILSAIYLPDHDPTFSIPNRMTPINTFRLIFREYFDADLELLPDRVFYWQHANPQGWGGRPDFSRTNEFVDVTDLMYESKRPSK